MKRALSLLFPILLALWPAPAPAERIFYRSEIWLGTSPAVQRLSLHGVLEGWERMAEGAGAGALSLRQREALRFHDCLAANSRSFEELLDRITAFSLARPDQVYYSLSDFIAEGLKGLCPGR